MGGFVDTMWELAIRGSKGDVQLSAPDLELFRDANKVRLDLNDYHGRVAFDDRNIEDILSILSFNSYSSKRNSNDRMATFVKAIGRTIEICCSVKHPGLRSDGSAQVVKDGPDLYRDFWVSLFAARKTGKTLPCIITFNYDLVLERSLFQVLNGVVFSAFGDPKPPASHVRIQHHFPSIPDRVYELINVRYGTHDSRDGTLLHEVASESVSEILDIEILKLHGSLNFPAAGTKLPSQGTYNVVDALPSPLILPPIFNKQSTVSQKNIWTAALERLRGAKNIVVVGYSLPRTDIYMQYFLKAALGPNVDLNRIFVFDPANYGSQKSAEEMKARYEECFSPQLRNRIHFKPEEVGAGFGSSKPGTAAHFVHALRKAPAALLF